MTAAVESLDGTACPCPFHVQLACKRKMVMELEDGGDAKGDAKGHVLDEGASYAHPLASMDAHEH